MRDLLKNRLQSAQRALEQGKTELTQIDAEIKKWSERIQGRFSASTAEQVAKIDSEVAQYLREYESASVKKRDALEAFGSSPRDQAVSARLNEATKEEQAAQGVLMQAIQNIVEGKLVGLRERPGVAAAIEVDDLARLFKRFGRHLQLIKFVRPNENGKNDRDIERTAAERIDSPLSLNGSSTSSRTTRDRIPTIRAADEKAPD